jgi:hypothetical protein
VFLEEKSVKKSNLVGSLIALASVVFGSVQIACAEQPQKKDFWGNNDCKESIHLHRKDGLYATILVRGRGYDETLQTYKLCLFEGNPEDNNPRYLGDINLHLSNRKGDIIPVSMSIPNLPKAMIGVQTVAKGKYVHEAFDLNDVKATKYVVISNFKYNIGTVFSFGFRQN